ncbi:MAG: hypothetical protein ABSG85_07155 [Spirochaetia bacterium]
MRLRRFTKFLLFAVVAMMMSLAAGPLIFGQQVVKTEVLYWHAGSPLRLRVTWVDNSYSLDLDGKEILTSQPGDLAGVDEWVRLDPILKVGENTLTFLGVKAPPPTRDPNSWRFDVLLESTATGGWSVLKDYSAKNPDYPGTAPSGLQYKLTVKITVRE